MISRYIRNLLKELGEIIKSHRLEKSWSQADLAERLGITRQTVMAIEKGNPKVSLGSALEAAHILGIPILPETNQNGIIPKKLMRKKVEISDDF